MADFSRAALDYFGARAIDPELGATFGVSERAGCLLFPYSAPDGSTYFRERSLNGGSAKVRQPTAQPLALWWPLGRPRNPSAIVCEGESDALAALEPLSDSHFARLEVAAIPGIGFPPARLAEQLAGAGVQEVFLVLDGDDAGHNYSARALAALGDAGIVAIPVELPKGTDLADNLVRAGDRAEWIANALADAEAAREEEPPASVDGAMLLDDLAAFVRRFVVVSDAQAAVIALWIVHAHAIEAAETTPYVSITSAEKESGKTRLLEVLDALVARPWFTGRVTAAVLVRKIDNERPTLLLDESDAAFKGEREYAEALRGLLNTGYRAGGKASLCVGQGAAISYRDFSTFGAKAIAGIGELPDTVASRAVPIRLERRAPAENVERWRERRGVDAAAPLRERAGAWASAVADTLRQAEPYAPPELGDRAQDTAEPLLAIADLAGGEWPERARAALVELHGEHAAEADSIGVRLLSDVYDAFEAHEDDRLSTAGLLKHLNGLEEAPWGEWNGRPLTARGLSKLLERYRVRSRTVRLDEGTTPKGYKREQFEDAWTRYLPVDPASIRHNATTRSGSGIRRRFGDATRPPCGG